MQTLEQRIEILEKRVKNLSFTLGFVGAFMVIAVIFGHISFENYANAQIKRDNPNVVATSIPNQGVAKVIEAQAFVLRDAKGKMRGMWSAESNNTTFALAFNDKDPSVVLSAGEDYANINVTDRDGNNITMNADSKLRSVAIMDAKDGNKVYLGASNKDTFAEFKANTDARLLISAKENLKIQGLAEKTSLSLAETRGSLINFDVNNDRLGMSFIDNKRIENLSVETRNQNTIMTIVSPLYKAKKEISVEK